MKKKRMIMIVAMVLVLVWREDVFAVESGTTQVSLQADWLQEGDYQYLSLIHISEPTRP